MFNRIKNRFLRYFLILIYFIIIFFCAIEVNFLWLFGYSPDMNDIKNPSMSVGSQLYTADGKLIGQYYMLRAMAYFDLVRLYGGVPLFLKAGLTSNTSCSRNRKKWEFGQTKAANGSGSLTTSPLIVAAKLTWPDNKAASGFMQYGQNTWRDSVQVSYLIPGTENRPAYGGGLVFILPLVNFNWSTRR